jgi:mRNA interferase MazF
MVAIRQGDIWWAELADPVGSEPGFRRPVVVVQCDEFNRSGIGTVLIVPLTSNLEWSDAPGNLLLPAKVTGLAKDSVANVSQLLAVDKTVLTQRVGSLPSRKLQLVLSGIDIVLGK